MGSDRLLVVLALLLAALGLVALLTAEGEAPLAPDALPEPEADDEPQGGELEGRGGSAPEPGLPPLPADGARLSPELVRERLRIIREAEEKKAQVETVVIEGVVLDHAGHPVAYASVYQLPDHLLAGSSPNAWTPLTQSDGAGRFDLRVRKPLAKSYVLARVAGGAPGWVPGTDVEAGRTLRIVLPEPTQLDVFLVDTEGKPLAGEGVRIVPVAARGVVLPLPGPASPMPEQYDVTDATGRARFQFGRSVPVTVIPALDGLVADPLERWLPDSSGTVAFTVQKGATLVVKALDRATGAALEKTVWASVLERETGRELTSRSSAQANGVLRTEVALLPGWYDVLVTMGGREPELVRDVQVTHAGAEVEVTARMGPLADAATLTLVLPPPPSVDTDGRRSRGRGRLPPIVFTKRMDGGFERHGWVRRNDAKAAKDRPDTFNLTMRPAPYEVVVMNANTGRVAHLRSLSLAAGARKTRRLAMAPGVVVKLHEILPADVHVRDVRVIVPRVGRFPAVGYNPVFSSQLRASGGLVNSIAPAGSRRRSSAQASPLLGPYPGSSVELEVTDWEGAVHRYPARGG